MARRDPHYRGDYDARARRLVAAAKADPFTLCWRCKRTLQDRAPHKTGKAPYWTAGHVIDGNPASPLLPEASTCNYTAGAELGLRKQTGTTRAW